MKRREINILVKRGLRIGLTQDWYRKVVKKVLDTEGVRGSVELGLVITDTETVRYLNKTYRQKDMPTDVLAFQMVTNNQSKNGLPFVNSPDGVTHLGEVVLAYPVAEQQAQEEGHKVEYELALLIVHGVLHLLGYDHEQAGDRQRMSDKEKLILELLGYSG